MLAEAAGTPAELEAMLARREAGLPLEQIVGWAEFAGVRIHLAAGVFVPRPRSEFLFDCALQLARARSARDEPLVVDLCCGSGALGAALLAALEDVELHAADIDPVAVRCARANLEDTRATVHEGDLFDALPAWLQGRVDLLVANVPYVPSADLRTLPREAREHEPRRALDGGSDGLRILARLSASATSWLAPGGSLLAECSDAQAAAAAEILSTDGLAPGIARESELGTCVISGTRPPP